MLAFFVFCILMLMVTARWPGFVFGLFSFLSCLVDVLFKLTMTVFVLILIVGLLVLVL